VFSFPNHCACFGIQCFGDLTIINTVKNESDSVDYSDAGVSASNRATPDFWWTGLWPLGGKLFVRISDAGTIGTKNLWPITSMDCLPTVTPRIDGKKTEGDCIKN
jgi:hypothetical protein